MSCASSRNKFKKKESEKLNPEGATKEWRVLCALTITGWAKKTQCTAVKKFAIPVKPKPDVENMRNQLKMEMCCFGKLFFPELQGLQEKRKADYSAVCKKMKERKFLDIRIKHALKKSTRIPWQAAQNTARVGSTELG